MESYCRLICIATAIFAVTSIDDIFLLVGFFSDARYHGSEVIAGQYAGIGVLIIISAAASMFAVFIPPSYLSLLGVIPILIGSSHLIEKARNRNQDAPPEKNLSVYGGHGRITTVALVIMSNGADNISAYVPVFSIYNRMSLMLVLAVIAILTTLWCLLARWIVRQTSLKFPSRTHSSLVMPIMLIALGFFVLRKGH